jgi:parallel beta-helix repeat protein
VSYCRPRIELLEERVLPSTFTVTTTADSGTGSLRQAILNANGNPGPNTIAFNLPGTGLQTIKPTSPLPAITNSVLLDGTSQPGYAGTPLIVLNGQSAGSAVAGLTVTAGSTTIEGLDIGGFSAAGIVLSGTGATNDLIKGNYIGLAFNGTSSLANGGDGISIDSGAQTNVIQGNVISANGSAGIRISGGGTSGNLVTANLIGTDATGSKAIGNGNTGITISTGATANTIGGAGATARNVISGNLATSPISGIGVYITDSGTADNVVAGNFIGTSAAGNAAVPNATWGVIVADSPANTIGGTTTAAGNLVSGNSQGGIAIMGANAVNNAVQDNDIGLDSTGNSPLGNAYSGVYLGTASGFSLPITGSASASVVSGNVISANGGYGIWINGSGATGNLLQGNYVGTNPAGSAAIPNALWGVEIDDASFNTIGGTTPTTGNVVSGNSEGGVRIAFSDATGNLLQGNYIGTNASGSVAIANAFSGVLLLDTPGNTIGGATAVAGNLVSGNGEDGLVVIGANAIGDTIEHNFIGLDATGTSGLGNTYLGLYIGTTAGWGTSLTGSATNCLVLANFISANGNAGVVINGTGADANVLLGNFIGVNALGNGALGNGQDGVFIANGGNNTIGGLASGAGNLISGNGAIGVDVSGIGGGGSGNVLEGNLIGTDESGTIAIPNQQQGVFLNNAQNTTIGGPSSGARNIISGNLQDGVMVFGSGSTGDVVQGNYVGVSAQGTSALGNGAITSSLYCGVCIRASGSLDTIDDNVISGNRNGVSVDNGSFENTVSGNFIGTDHTGRVAVGNVYGGLAIEADANHNTVQNNVVSGNGTIGIEVVGTAGVTNNLIAGNMIGVDVTGTRALGNGGDGVAIFEPDNTLGGTTPQARNVISGNGGNGVGLYDYIGAATNTLVLGNLIGTDVTGQKPLGNRLDGVVLRGLANSNQVGNAFGGGNTIAFNGLAGVAVIDSSTVDNAIRGNSIFGNGDIGIDLGGNGPVANHSGSEVGPNNYQNFPIITGVQAAAGSYSVGGTLNSLPNSVYTLDVYGQSAPGTGGAKAGQTYLGSVLVTTDGQGNAVFNATFSGTVAAGEAIEATATDVGGNTSEFSPAVTLNPLPSGGQLALNTPTGGALLNTGQVDTWTFFGRKNQTVVVVVNTGPLGYPAPLQPSLNYAQVQIVDSHGTVVASVRDWATIKSSTSACFDH